MDPWLRRTGDFYPKEVYARMVVTNTRVADTRVDKQEDTRGNRFQVQGTISQMEYNLNLSFYSKTIASNNDIDLLFPFCRQGTYLSECRNKTKG